MNGPSLILSRRVKGFQRFFEMGQEESVSPFLSEEGQRLSRNLSLKSACLSAFFLIAAFVFRFVHCESIVPFLLALVFFLAGSPALAAAIEDIFLKKDVNIDVLMTVAAFGALLMGNPMEGALLLVLFEISAALEDLVTYRAKKSLLRLGEINPEKALCVDKEGALHEKAIQDIPVGDVVLVRSGEVVPLDGAVIGGQASCSLVHLTGEENPLFFSLGASVPSGARVVEGSLSIKTSVTASESTIAKLILLITRARAMKPDLARTFDTWGRWYAALILLLSGAILLLFPLFTDLPFLGDTGVVYRAITFLVTASPCALILAMPISYVSAIGSLVRKGAILKGGVILDRLNRCDTVAFDKTGTLTMGSFEVVHFERIQGTMDEERALSLFASLEQYAVHPLAKAVVRYVQQKGLPLFSSEDVRVEPGKGLLGRVDHESVRAGSHDYMQKDVGAYASFPGASEIFVSFGEGSLFVCFLKDSLRKESVCAIEKLKQLKKRVVLLSGDKDVNVQSVASLVNVDEVVSEATPEEKVSKVSSFLKGGLVMVGDGLNDAPALAQATVGISMGTFSSASAREASDVILLHDDLELIPFLFTKARQTRSIVRQNLFVATLAILAGTIPSLGGLIPLWVAVLLHEGSTLLVGLNSLRLLGSGRTN